VTALTLLGRLAEALDLDLTVQFTQHASVPEGH
jgi:hypothetical protein